MITSDPNEGNVTFTPVTIGDSRWCPVCERSDPREPSFCVVHASGSWMLRHVKCILSRPSTWLRGTLNARAFHSDVVATFGSSCASVESVAKGLAKVFPHLEVDVTGRGEPGARMSFDCMTGDVVAAAGSVLGWCEECGTDGWGQPMVVFSSRGSDSHLFYHRACIETGGVEDGPLSTVEVHDAIASMTKPPTVLWTIEPPTERHVAELLRLVFPETDEVPVCAAVADLEPRMMGVVAGFMGSLATAPKGPEGDAARDALMKGCMLQLVSEVLNGAMSTETEEESQALEANLSRVAQKMRDVERLLIEFKRTQTQAGSDTTAQGR